MEKKHNWSDEFNWNLKLKLKSYKEINFCERILFYKLYKRTIVGAYLYALSLEALNILKSNIDYSKSMGNC